MKTVLIATSGMSPAVLTETVWALAQENPSIVPDEVKVITTVSGKAQICEKLLNSGVWSDLRTTLKVQPGALRFHEGNIIVAHDSEGTALDNLSDVAGHTAFADTIMHELWAYTSQPETRVIASLAGGYKTMSALMLSTMQLLANPGDRITHVLVSGGLDAPNANFFFPTTQEQADHVHLIDIPLIPLRRWFDTLNRKPGSYDELVNSSLEAVRKRAGDLHVELSSPRSTSLCLKLNGKEHRLTHGNYAYFSFFADRKINPNKYKYEPWEDFPDWIKELYEKHDQFHVLKHYCPIKIFGIDC